MATIKTPAYKVVRRKNGRTYTYYYAWKGRGAPALKAAPGSAEFIRELNDALASRRSGDKTKIDGLVIAYKSDESFVDLGENTKRNWSRWLDRIRLHFGKLSIRQFDRPTIKEDILRWRNKWKSAPRNADYGIQVLSAVMSYAVRNGKLSVNPCAKIEKLYKSNRSDVIWTDAHLALLQKHASPDVFRAAKLSSLTGLRQDDCMTLKWTELDKLAIEKVTAKSISKRRKSDPKIAIIPMYKELKEFLSSIERDSTYVLTSSKGEPWSGFSSSWNDTLKKAGLDKLDLHFHDLRGTAATKFYSIGLTVTDIALILGWSEKDVTKILDKYVNRSAVLRQRIRRMNRAIEAQEAAEVEDAAEIENVA